MKEMCTLLPQGSCPNCGHIQFIVYESIDTMYLTNRDGEIIDAKEVRSNISGMCIKCNKVYKMFPTREGFIPLTKLREIVLDYSPSIENFENIINPMEMK